MTKRKTVTKKADAQTEPDYKEVFFELINNPAVRYVAGGVATALLSRLATRMNDRYPEISGFIRENIEDLESYLGVNQNETQDTLSEHH